MNSLPRQRSGLALAAIALLVAACGQPAPTGAPAPARTPMPVSTPTPLSHPVAAITLVGAVGEDEPGSRSELAWQGVAQAGSVLGARSTLVAPLTAAELNAAVPAAASAVAPAGAVVVVTVGPTGARAALAAATEHPAALFFVLDVPIPSEAPPNVHGLVFDDAEAGYLAGYLATEMSSTGNIGFVAAAKPDPAAEGYLAGMRSGAQQADPGGSLVPFYAGASPDPQKGRAAVDALIAGGAGAVVARPDLTGYGAMRQACARGIHVVALETEAARLLPDVRPCLVASILRRYDVAVRDAITGFAMGRQVPRVAVGSVANGGIAPGPFANTAAPQLAADFQDVLAALRAGMPRPTAMPADSPSAPPSSSP